MILRDLSDTYNLPQLKKLSRYGTWQEHYPEVKCGIKRGFSYYRHFRNEPFTSDKHHSNELLVAASTDDQNSDTQWYRPDTDTLFVEMVKDAGIDYLDHTDIKSIEKRSANSWYIEANSRGNDIHLKAGFIIDATGSPDFSAMFFGTTSSAEEFETTSRAIYSHFENVPEWKAYLKENGFSTEDYPYNPDHSALHHLLQPGWMWMLRFNDGLLSTGLVLDGIDKDHQTADEEWHSVVSNYPSLKRLFDGAKIANPPDRFIKTGRLQRKLNKMYGDGWAALHHTAGFVDPLHSTGIAHSLAGVEKLLSILIETNKNPQLRNEKLHSYQSAFFDELALIDLLVAGCYKSRHHFDLFTAFTMLYFTCTIQYEQYRLSGKTPGLFLSADNPELSSIVQSCYNELNVILNKNESPSENDIRSFVRLVSEKIQPYNRVGLMDPSKKNMYEHTAVTI